MRTHFAQHEAGMSTFRKKPYTHATEIKYKQYEETFTTKLSAYRFSIEDLISDLIS